MEGSFLSRLAEAETRTERSFSKSVSLCTFPSETCAGRSFSRSFSLHRSCLERWLAHVTSRNLREMAMRGGPGALVRARYQPKPARNGHAGGAGAPVRHQCAERSWKRSFSPRTFRPETRVKRSFSKSIPPHRFRLRQTVPKRCQKGTCGHHDGNPWPS